MNQTERIGRFEVQERLRSNAFAIIYRGRDPFDGRRVQIKFCVATDESIRRRFLAAAEQAATLRHPNIATVFEFGSGDSKPYLVQEAFSEETLSDLLARREPTEDVLKLYYLMQIARGLQYAHHREVLHRELRPAAVMVDRTGEAKLADFGTARLASAFAQLGNGAHRWPAVGWLLPELILGLDLDERSDIYGFGALAFELLTGRPPYVAESLSQLVPQILETDPEPVGVHWPECPPELDRLILRCLSRDPGRRFCSMDEVLDEFDAVVPVPKVPDYVEQERTLVIEEATGAADTGEIEMRPVVAAAAAIEPLPAPVETDEIEISSLQVDTDAIEIEALGAGPDAIEIEEAEAEIDLGEPQSAKAEGESPPRAGELPGGDDELATAASTQVLRQRRQVDWQAPIRIMQTRASELGRAMRPKWRRVKRRTGSIRLAKPRIGFGPRRLRTAGIVLGAVLLSGVVGWSVVRDPGPSLDVPTVAPEMPLEIRQAARTGTMVVDTQPWGEVMRIVDEAGREVELPGNRFTPLPLDLAPGLYTVEISRPELEEVFSCEVRVEADTTARCQPQIASLGVDDLFRQTGWWQ